MKILATLCVSWIVALAFELPCCAKAETPETNNLVLGVLARAEAVLSGRFEYNVTTGVDSTGKVSIEEHNEFTLSGPSWRVDYLNSHTQRINHNDTYLEVARDPQPDDSVYTRVRLEGSESIQKRTPHPPYFAGTLWYRSTIEYIREHVGEARLMGEKEVNGIPTRILEWQVPEAERYNAFDRINSILDKGGMLRLYVAPQLGYALPRIEHVGIADTVSKRFDSTDFEEPRAGLFFPKHCSYQLFSEDGSAGYYTRYEILEMGDVNEPIPDEDFIVSLPKGTSVTDRRTSPGADFRIGSLSSGLPSDLVKVIHVEGQTPVRNWANATPRGILIGISALLLLVVLYLLYCRRIAKSQ